MGSWNGTCAVSNMHIHSGQEVAVFMLLENKEKKSFCYENALYDVCPLPFYGEYNDYGAVENCSGFGLPIILDQIKKQLYEFGQGPNPYHDPVVKRSNFNLEVMFDADHEDRLGIQGHRTWSGDDYDKRELEEMDSLTADQQFELDRLAAKLKQVETFRRVTHVIIHGVVFKNIMEKWFIEQYIGDGKGTSGYGNNYNNVYFKDIVDSIPEYVENCKKKYAPEEGDVDDPKSATLRKHMLRYSSDNEDWNHPNLATKWMGGFGNSSSDVFGLISVKDYVAEYCEAGDWDGLAAFVKEALTGRWVNSFMSYTRKVWTKQTGVGSQSNEESGYLMIAQSIHDVIKADKERYGSYDDEDEDEEVDLDERD